MNDTTDISIYYISFEIHTNAYVLTSNHIIYLQTNILTNYKTLLIPIQYVDDDWIKAPRTISSAFQSKCHMWTNANDTNIKKSNW